MTEKSNPESSPTVVTTADVEKQAPSPTCESFFNQLKKAKANSNGPIEFCKAVSAVFDSAEPPTGESILGKVREKTTDSTGKPDVCRMLALFTFCSVIGVLVIGLVFALPVAEIAIGTKYLHECPAERYIPIYLIVAGVFGLVSLIPMGNSKKDKKKEVEDNEDDDENCKGGSCSSAFKSLINVFMFGWFIAGNVWVYGLAGEWVAEPSTAVNYCHSTVYNFAFWAITGAYIVLGVLLLCIVCALVVFGVWAFSSYKCNSEKC